MRELHAELRIVYALDVGQVSLDADIIQTSRLAESDGLIGKRIRTPKIFNGVHSIVRVNRKYCGRTEDMYVAWCDVDGINKLSLILARILLVKLIRRLEPIACQKEVQVKGVVWVGTVINSVEDIYSRAMIV